MRLRVHSVALAQVYTSTKPILFFRVFRAAAFGSGRPGRSSDSVYFRVKFSPGCFAISRCIVPRTIHSQRRNTGARRNPGAIVCLRAVCRPSCFRRNFRKFDLDAGVAPLFVTHAALVSLNFTLSGEP